KATRRRRGGTARSPRIRPTPNTRRRPSARFRCSSRRPCADTRHARVRKGDRGIGVRHSRMDTFLELAENLPRQSFAEGATLLAEGAVPGRLYELLEGTLRIEKGGMPITLIREPGSCVGELSLLLGVPATADVIVVEPATIAVAERAAEALAAHPHLALVLARLLATRVQHMTTYLAD